MQVVCHVLVAAVAAAAVAAAAVVVVADQMLQQAKIKQVSVVFWPWSFFLK